MSTGFDLKRVLSFLKQLKRNNTRDWFQENRDSYTQSLNIVRNLVAYILKELSKYDPEIENLEPQHCIYRIYRDVRFSKDKTPYKVHFGAFIAPDGRTSGNAGYYYSFKSRE